MPTIRSGDVDLDVLDNGEGDPIVLIHGFASTKEVNWVNPGWVATLTGAGRRVIAFDNRGHGRSSKPTEPAAYHTNILADDTARVMDALDIARADLLGYSMGARIAAFTALRTPDRVRSLVMGGLGAGLIEGVGLPESIAIALEAPDISHVSDPQGRMFRAFADQTKSDRIALAACIRGTRQTLTRQEVFSINAPALIAVGTKDDIAGDPKMLAGIFQKAEPFAIEGRDHMLAVGDKSFKAKVLSFLEARP